MKPPLRTFLAIAVTLAGCSAAPPYNPFKIQEADIKGRVKIIALAPINIPTNIENPEPVKFKFEALVAAKLREGGFNVVPSTEYAAIWKQTAENFGGIYDAVTGKRNEEKTMQVRERTLRELGARTRADALLDFALVIVKADFTANLAEWNGMAEYIRPGGAWSAFSGPISTGNSPALSLRVILSDLRGVDMYDNLGGLQLLSKLYGMKFVEVPRIDLFIDEARNIHAVDAALNPLVGKAGPPDFPPSNPSPH